MILCFNLVINALIESATFQIDDFRSLMAELECLSQIDLAILLIKLPMVD